jgi:hypothetical protein
MPWMGPGKAYYYTKTYRRGRIRLEYIGAGPAAELVAQYDQIDQERRALLRMDRRIQRSQIDQDTRLPAELLDYAGIVGDLVCAALEAAGYHQHKRGEWRKRRMKQLSDAAPTRAEFRALFDAASAEGSTVVDRERLRRMAAKHPELGRAFDLANLALTSLIEGMPADQAGKAIAAGRAEALRSELSGPAPSVLERLLIDQVVLAYLHVNMVEYQHGPLMGTGTSDTAIIEFWERRLDAAQRRYLRAIEGLARVRRLLNLPAVQINIATNGGQQVNVAAGEVQV